MKTVTLTVVTKVVHNEADYAAVPAIITKLSGGGYFELGNDIVSATGSITLVPLTTTNPFSGTFDGCGYVIDGLTGFSGNYGFVGKELTATGVIKNIGFTNVVHTDGCASMLVMTDAGTLQNIYIDYAATGTKSRRKFKFLDFLLQSNQSKLKLIPLFCGLPLLSRNA